MKDWLLDSFYLWFELKRVSIDWILLLRIEDWVLNECTDLKFTWERERKWERESEVCGRRERGSNRERRLIWWAAAAGSASDFKGLLTTLLLLIDSSATLPNKQNFWKSRNAYRRQQAQHTACECQNGGWSRTRLSSSVRLSLPLCLGDLDTQSKQKKTRIRFSSEFSCQEKRE